MSQPATPEEIAAENAKFGGRIVGILFMLMFLMNCIVFALMIIANMELNSLSKHIRSHPQIPRLRDDTTDQEPPERRTPRLVVPQGRYTPQG